MDKDFAAQQEKLFAAEKQAFEQAKARYLAACEQFNYFGDEHHLLKPPTVRAAYSDRMAWIMAKMANLAYVEFERGPEERDRLELDLKSGGFTLVETFIKLDTQAFLAKSKTFAVFSFRGTQTDSVGDIDTDIQADMLATINGKVHRGFDTAYNLIADDINASVSKIGKLPLYVTGHSLGAALATIAVQSLEKSFGDQIAALYTFGSPRVGNDEFDNSLKPPIYRMVNATDGVTLIPFVSWGYTHAGDARYLTRHGALRRGIPLRERFWDIFIAISLSLFSPPPWILRPFIYAHSMSEYIAKLEKIAEARN